MNKEIIGVVGAGAMGGGIAQMFAENGFQTLVWDVDGDFADKGIANIRKRLDKSIEKGKLDSGTADRIFSRIKKIDALDCFSGTTLIIEAIVENQEIKTSLYKKLEQAVDKETVIATNTSSLSVVDLSQSLEVPSRFLGVHFFNPPTRLDLVELVATPVLDPAVAEKVQGILDRCGKSAVSVKDSPGFIVNRLLLPFINEAAKLLDSGVASAEDIDLAMCLGSLHPAGPLKVADLIGLDVCKSILETLAESLNRSDFKPAESIIKRVEAGEIGRKAGKGFYEY